jgi:uncharacterized protein YbjT (DUF2867 family)
MPQVTGKVLIIGASGFVGRHLAQLLLADRQTVRCMARDTKRIQDLADAGGEVVQGDILDPASVARALESVQAVYICIHTLSPQGANSAAQNFMDVEKSGLRNIVNACRTAGVRRLIYVTSIGIAPDAPSAWVRGRSQTEQLLFDSGLDVSVIRPGMIVGRGGTGFDAIARGARRPAAIVLGSGQQRFRTIAVDDLAYYLVGVLDDPRSFGHSYDVGSDDVLTTGQMIDIAAECLGRRHPVKIHVPSGLVGLAAPLIERVTRMPRGAMKGLVDSLQVDMTGDPTPIRTILQRSPQTYRQALEHALN